jgi:hypothetical protein
MTWAAADDRIGILGQERDNVVIQTEKLNSLDYTNKEI